MIVAVVVWIMTARFGHAITTVQDIQTAQSCDKLAKVYRDAGYNVICAPVTKVFAGAPPAKAPGK